MTILTRRSILSGLVGLVAAPAIVRVAHWALLAEYILPRRYHWLITPNNMTRGMPINQAIVDPTGTQAMRICSAGLMNGLMSEGVQPRNVAYREYLLRSSPRRNWYGDV